MESVGCQLQQAYSLLQRSVQPLMRGGLSLRRLGAGSIMIYALVHSGATHSVGGGFYGKVLTSQE